MALFAVLACINSVRMAWSLPLLCSKHALMATCMNGMRRIVSLPAGHLSLDVGSFSATKNAQGMNCLSILATLR
eukprot:5846808-Amphidinium_carterae.1